MKKNSIWMMTAAMGMAVAFCGTAFAQGNGNNQPTGQAGTTSNVVVTNTSAQPVPVTVTNQTTPPTSFTVNNTAAQAVPTKDRNNAAYQPFSYDMTYNFQTGEEFEIKQTSAVPLGKRLMLTTASSYLVNYQAGASWILHISTTCGNQTVSNWIPLTILKDRAAVSAPLNFCGDPGSIATAQLIRTTDANNALLAGPASIVSLSGYFVDVP